jgi:hypothetical protein
MNIRIAGGEALIDGRFEDAAIDVDSAEGVILDIDGEGKPKCRLDANGLLVCPASSTSMATRLSVR